jgi:MFS family permease
MLESFTQKKDKSLSVLHGEAATSSVENAGIAYQAPSLLSVGGSARDVALLSSVTNLIFALISIKIPSIVKTGDSLKKSTIILAALSAVAWLPLILVPLFVSNLPIAVLIALWVFSLAPSLLIAPIRDKWMADLIPSNRMGRYFGLRQVFSAGSYLTTFLMMGYLLDSPLQGVHNSFTLVFSIAFIGSLVSLLLYLIVRTSDSAPKEAGSRFGLLDFLHETKQNSMGSFMVYVTLVTFAASISGAFFSVYMLDDLHFTYLTYTLVISVEFIARIISLTVWGKIVDSSGALKLMKIVSWAIPFIPVFWLFSSNIAYLMAVQFISGISWAAFDLSNQTHICAASPEDKKLHYIVYQRVVITLASAIGPLLGAYLVNYMFPVYGSQILGIFLL